MCLLVSGQKLGAFLYIALAVLEFRYAAAWRKLLVFDMLFPSFLSYVS